MKLILKKSISHVLVVPKWRHDLTHSFVVIAWKNSRLFCLNACLIGLGIMVATCLKSWCMLGRKDHGRLGLCYTRCEPHTKHTMEDPHPWPSKWLVCCALISPMTCRPSVINEALMVSGDGLSPQPLNLFPSMLFNTTWDVSKQCPGSIWA